MRTKKCPKCGVTKPESGFRRRAGKPHLLTSWCVECDKLQSRDYHARNYDKCKEMDARYRAANRQKRREVTARFLARNPGYTRMSALRRNYGLTPEAYDALLAGQGGGCAICGATRSDGRSAYLSVDHCHTTNRIRGLLCNACNRGIGLLRDDPDLLSRAIGYLTQGDNISSKE